MNARFPVSPSSLETLLLAIAQTLDVPASAYEEASERYGAVGRWLCATDSAICSQHPVIYAQGSFALGTVIRPLRGEEYDIDAVVELAGPQDRWTPAELKAVVGDRLQSHEIYRGMLEPEGRRCWTLQYASKGDSHGFHLDLLPSVRSSASEGQPARASTPIAITNRVAPGVVEWGESNPKGYASWFRERMKTEFERQRRLLMEKRAKAHIEDVPDYEVRTPLQYIVQLLKRHRDVLFRDGAEHAPISVIITTLAAHAYEGETSLEGALFGILERMPSFVQKIDGRVVIPNPTRPNENFADRWEGDERKERAFLGWLESVQSLEADLLSAPAERLGDQLQELLGESTGRAAMTKFAALRGSSSPAVVLRSETSQPTEGTGLGLFARGYEGVVAGIQSLLTITRHRESVRWPLRLGETTVKLQGSVRGSYGQPGRQLKPFDVVGVGLSLQFDAIVGGGYGGEIFWQVVNTGSDAQRANGLRGKFESGTTTKVESTLYRGDHFVECFVIRNGNCVARSGEFVVRIQ
jgi:hypothetical protein